MQRITCLILIICLSIASGTALADKKAKKQHKGKSHVSASGLSAEAMAELHDAGVDQYLGESQSDKSDYGVWTKHDFSSENDGPI